MEQGMVSQHGSSGLGDDENATYRMMAVERYREKMKRRRVVLKMAVSVGNRPTNRSNNKMMMTKTTTTSNDDNNERENKKNSGCLEMKPSRDGLLPWVDASVCCPYVPSECHGGRFDTPDGGYESAHDVSMSIPCVFERQVDGTWCDLDGETTHDAFDDLGWDHLFQTDSLFQSIIEGNDCCSGQSVDLPLLCNETVSASKGQTAECADDWVQSVLKMEKLDESSVPHCKSKIKKEAGCSGRKKKEKENLAANNNNRAEKRPGANVKAGNGKAAVTVKRKKQKTVQAEKQKEEDALIYVQDVFIPSFSTGCVQKKQDGSNSQGGTEWQSQKDLHDDGRNSQKPLSTTFPKKRTGQKKARGTVNATKGRKNAKSASVKETHGILGTWQQKEANKRVKETVDGTQEVLLGHTDEHYDDVSVPSNIPTGTRTKCYENRFTWSAPSHGESSVENRMRFPVLYPGNETRPFHVVSPVLPVYGLGPCSIHDQVLHYLGKCEQ